MPFLPRWPQRAAHHLAALLPSSCALCGVPDSEALCSGCHAQFFQEARQRCRQCASPLSHTGNVDSICGDCMAAPPAFDATVVATDYAPPVDQMVLALKFASHLSLAPLCARMLHEAWIKAPKRPMPGLLVVVPLGEQRLAERGFNQALEIAGPLAKWLNIPLERRALWRQRDTRAQSLLHPDERHDNIRGVFSVAEAAADGIRGKHVGVIDDVITTGATLNEVAMTLKRAGAASVTNLVFARTPPR